MKETDENYPSLFASTVDGPTYRYKVQTNENILKHLFTNIPFTLVNIHWLLPKSEKRVVLFCGSTEIGFFDSYEYNDEQRLEFNNRLWIIRGLWINIVTGKLKSVFPGLAFRFAYRNPIETYEKPKKIYISPFGDISIPHLTYDENPLKIHSDVLTDLSRFKSSTGVLLSNYMKVRDEVFTSDGKPAIHVRPRRTNASRVDVSDWHQEITSDWHQEITSDWHQEITSDASYGVLRQFTCLPIHCSLTLYDVGSGNWVSEHSERLTFTCAGYEDVIVYLDEMKRMFTSSKEGKDRMLELIKPTK
jgi:hypothetical protein